MATTALQIIEDARVLLKDEAAVAWDDQKLLNWLNAGQREIAAVRPDAYPQFAVVTTVVGTRQSLPAGAVMLLNVQRNMAVDGTTPGRAIRKCGRDELDSVNPEWHTDAPQATARNYVYDTYTPKVFYLYPPSVAGSKVEVTYSAVPPDVASVGGNISLDDSFRNPLLDYVLYRAYSEDLDTAGAGPRAMAHRQAFDAFLGLKARADVSTAAAEAGS